MVSDLTAMYLQCKVALDFVDRHIDSIDDTLAEMATFIPEFMDEFCDVSDALDFFLDNIITLREKIDERLSKIADMYNSLEINNRKNKEADKNER